MKPLADITVLVAEDERSVRMLLRIVLESSGARVLEAEHGAQAWRLLQLHPEVDVVLTDVNMPVLDGVALARRVRALRPELPVVACTAMDVDVAYPAILPLVADVVQKPFIPSDLVRAIGAALETCRTRRSIAAS